MIMKDTLRYELPPDGTTLLGYIVRRMHKTELLVPVPHLIATGATAAALGRISAYAVAASTSFGRAYYQPRFNSQGEEVSEADPATGAVVRAKLESSTPHYRISYSVKMPDGSSMDGAEEITGTTVGLRGLGMPAPSKYRYQYKEYFADLTGTLTSELVLSLIGRTRIRGYGLLNLVDGAGNTGKMRVERSGHMQIEVNGKEMILDDQAANVGT